MSIYGDQTGFSEYAGDPTGVAGYRNQRQKQLIADLLMKQGLQKPKGEMVGRFYVPQSWAQDLSSAAQQGIGGLLSGMAMKEGMDAAKQRADSNAAAVQAYQQNMQNAQGGQTVEAAGPGAPVIDPNAPPPAAAPVPPAYGLAPAPPPPQAPPPQMMEGPRPTAVTPPDLMAQKNLMRDALMQQSNPGLTRAAGLDYQQAFQEKEHAAAREQALEMRKQQNELLLGITGAKEKGAMARTDFGKVQRIDELLAETDRESPEFKTLTDMKAKLVAIPGAGSDIVLKDTDKGIMRASKSTGKTSALLAPDQKTPLQPVEPRPAITVMVGPNGEPVANAVGRGGKMTPLPGTSFHGSTADSNIKLRTVNEKEFTDGPSGKTLNAINTAQGHIALWLKAQDALRNEGIQGFNRVSAFIGKQLGVAAPTDLAGVASVLAPEIMKSTVPGAGGEMERIAIEKQLGVALSPEQATGLADQFHGLMVGKAKALQQQYMSGQGATDENWQKKLNPDIKRRIAEADAAASKTNQSSRPTVILKFNARGEQLP